MLNNSRIGNWISSFCYHQYFVGVFPKLDILPRCYRGNRKFELLVPICYIGKYNTMRGYNGIFWVQWNIIFVKFSRKVIFCWQNVHDVLYGLRVISSQIALNEIMVLVCLPLKGCGSLDDLQILFVGKT